MFCGTNCVGTLVATDVNKCKVVPRSGGIVMAGFAKCDLTIADPSDTAEWAAAVTADNLTITGRVKGSKAKGSATKVKFDSCSPEQTNNIERSVTIQDYNSDNTGFTNYAFYNDQLSNAAGRKFMFITCDELVYFWIENISVEIDDVIEEDENGNIFFDVTVAWDQLLMITPVRVPGILTALVEAA